MRAKGTDLFAVGCQALSDLRAELAATQVQIDPKLELRAGEALLCYYNLEDGHIYLSAPDPEQPRGKFELLFYRSLLNLASNDAVVRFLALLIPWLVAHEVGHHLRHRYGCFGANLMEEEQIANQLATAFVKPRLTYAEILEFQGALARALTYLSRDLTPDRELASSHPARGLIRHVHAHAASVYRDLNAPEALSIAEFARLYLNSNAEGGGQNAKWE